MIDYTKVSVVVPCLTEDLWQVHLTEACLKMAISGARTPFELIICEAVGNHFENFEANSPLVPDPVKYHHRPEKGFANADQNAGLDLATGRIVVLLTNDVFVKPGWLEALVDCFKYEDCGMASLGTSDHAEQPLDVILEGLWCPVMALLNDPRLRFDAETFPSYWGDTDLVMKVYNSGFRAYRNFRVVCDHLGRATNTESHPAGKAAEIERARELFAQRHSMSPLLIYRVLMQGAII